MKLFHNRYLSLKNLQADNGINAGGKENNLEKLKVATKAHPQRRRMLLFLARA